MTNQQNIIKVLVGSRAHGLADDNSDYDYRGVFLVPTETILSLGSHTKNTNWVEGKEDDTSWELGHFLNLATHCNPTILEVFHAPVINTTPQGEILRGLFGAIWNKKDLVNAHVGYGLNQRKKFLENKDNRRSKYASAYLRTLYQAWSLLVRDIYPVSMTDTTIYSTLQRYRAGKYEVGEVIDTCLEWQAKVEAAAAAYGEKETELEAINDFLLEMRKDYWSDDGQKETKEENTVGESR